MSTRGRYALIIMVDLAKNKDSYLSLNEIASKENISVKYLERIMSLLLKSELVSVTRGKNGGYKLVRKPEEYTLGEIFRVTEGDMKPIDCIGNDETCEKKDECQLYMFYEGLFNNMNNYMDNKTLKDFI